MPDHDDLFKELISNFFFEFLELFAPPNFVASLNRLSLIHLDKELPAELGPGRSHRADLVFRLTQRSSKGRLLFHIELESSYKRDLPERMFYYHASLRKKYALPVFSMAVLSARSPRAKPASSILNLNLAGVEFGYFKFQLLQLSRLMWSDFLAESNPVASALMSCMWYTEAERPDVKLECLRHLAQQDLLPDRSAIIQKFIDAYLDLSPSEKYIFQAKVNELQGFERNKIMTYITSWERDGIQKGLILGRAEGKLEGKAEGKAEGKIELVCFLLSKRFGILDENLVQTICKLDALQVDQLSELLLDLPDVNALEAWLSSSLEHER